MDNLNTGIVDSNLARCMDVSLRLTELSWVAKGSAMDRSNLSESYQIPFIGSEFKNWFWTGTGEMVSSPTSTNYGALQFPARWGAKVFLCLPPHPNWLRGLVSLLSNRTGGSDTHFYPLLMFRMLGFAPPFPHTSSWRCA